jgi:S-adenosylmethionine-diacylgycerolhomoserine-N-methlytransferase
MPEPAPAGRFGLESLARFYAFHAPIYDWTRPLILFGRDRLVEGLGLGPGLRVLDVGCGTGHNLAALAASGAQVTGVEPSPAMLEAARRRVERLHLPVALDSRPYGAHDTWHESVDRIVFSYSLSMIPPWPEALARASLDLRPGGRIGVVDFLNALDPLTDAWLRSSHVFLGAERLAALRDLFPCHELQIGRGVTWRYFLFWGEAD